MRSFQLTTKFTNQLSEMGHDKVHGIVLQTYCSVNFVVNYSEINYFVKSR